MGNCNNVVVEEITSSGRTHTANIQNIQLFAERFGLSFVRGDTVGLGNSCVGLKKNGKWVEYNPMNWKTLEDIDGFCDERFTDIVPDGAYTKKQCLVVLGTDCNAITQLSNWVDDLKTLNVVVERFDTGATGHQALINGKHSYGVKIP